MDDLDRNILTLLGADARMSVATLARRLKVARSTIQARLERLETTGIIAGYTLKLGAVMKFIDFSGTDLSGRILDDADFTGSVFDGCRMLKTRLDRAV